MTLYIAGTLDVCTIPSFLWPSLAAGCCKSTVHFVRDAVGAARLPPVALNLPPVTEVTGLSLR